MKTIARVHRIEHSEGSGTRVAFAQQPDTREHEETRREPRIEGVVTVHLGSEHDYDSYRVGDEVGIEITKL